MDALLDNPLESFFAEHELSFLHPTYSLIAIVSLIVIVLLYFALRGSKTRRARGTIRVITGISNAGKTALFAKLYRGTFDKTVSSLEENDGTFPFHGFGDTKYRIVDFPGHLEVRDKLVSNYLPNAKCVVFMVDAILFPIQVREVASYLYFLLMDKSINDLEIPILIACNKSEKKTARTPEEIREKLEKELNQLRETRTSMPGIQGENADDNDEDFYLGYENQPFEFTHLPFEVEFVACSVESSGELLNPLVSFLTRD
mmetsp:Transcript_134861/g.200635  ORF Transcript_134861/g.200635 Transcript_134861/m.200635 type:complete len:258 (+) Transcript_134861:43-816(+)